MVSFLVSMRTPCVPSRPRVFAHADFCISHSFPCPVPPTPALLRMTAQDAMSSREPLVPQPEKPPSLGPRHSVGTFPLALSTALLRLTSFRPPPLPDARTPSATALLGECPRLRIPSRAPSRWSFRALMSAGTNRGSWPPPVLRSSFPELVTQSRGEVRATILLNSFLTRIHSQSVVLELEIR